MVGFGMACSWRWCDVGWVLGGVGGLRFGCLGLLLDWCLLLLGVVVVYLRAGLELWLLGVCCDCCWVG